MENLIIALRKNLRIKKLILALMILSNVACGQTTMHKLYPFSYDSMLEIKSPIFINDSVESVLIVTKDDKYALAPVTVDNGKPLLYNAN